MDYARRQNWRVALKLRLFESVGENFQDFFADIMQRKFGPGYVRVRPYGQLGDSGCDGYRMDTGAVHQCYAPIQGPSKVSTLTEKMQDDFAKANQKLKTIMRSWIFTHNYMTGLPVEAVSTLETLRAQNSELTFAFAGPVEIEDIVLSLPEPHIEDLLGPAAADADYSSPDMSAIASMLEAIALGSARPLQAEIKPVPLKKINYNLLSEQCAYLINQGMLNEPLVGVYIGSSSDATLGDRIATALRERYSFLRDAGFSPDEVYARLQNAVLGNIVSPPSPAKQVAAQAIVSYFFHRCDIFEDEQTPDLAK